MSGGHFHYKKYKFRDIADEIERTVSENDSTEKDSYGDEKGSHYPKEILDRFVEAARTIRRAGDMLHCVDYLICGDYGEESFLEAWEEKIVK